MADEKAAIPQPPQIRDFPTAIAAFNHLWGIVHEHLAHHAAVDMIPPAPVGPGVGGTGGGAAGL
ncbi:MAG: hypothetical protein ACYCOR_19185 [Acidobacteriaceae bacterium]